MKKLLVYMAVFVVIVAGLGFYRGWFTMSTTTETGNNRVEVNLTVDPDKARDDAEELTDNVLPDSLVPPEGTTDGTTPESAASEESTEESTPETEVTGTPTTAPGIESPETLPNDN